MGLFKPKYARIEDAENEVEEEQPIEAISEEPIVSGGNTTLSTDIIKLKAKFDQFSELRNVINDRFTRINEQIGELRGMVLDANRSMQDMEVKTVKAVDLVEAVHPDKLMVDVRKQDAKIEALKANIESNEAIMKSLMDQLKSLRQDLTAFRGIEEVVKLSDEVKKELMNTKKTQATVERHADKIESIFVETQKKFQDFEIISTKLKEIQEQVSPAVQQVDQNKVKITTLASKKDVEGLINKLNDFEKHVGNIIDLLTKRSNDLPKEIEDRFKKLEKSMNDTFEKKIKRAETLNKLMEKIEKNAPIIAKELQISDKLNEVNVKKIETKPSQVIEESVEKTEEERKGIMSRLFKSKESKEESKENQKE